MLHLPGLAGTGPVGRRTVPSKQFEAVLPGEAPIGGLQEGWDEVKQLDGPLQPSMVLSGGLFNTSGAEVLCACMKSRMAW